MDVCPICLEDMDMTSFNDSRLSTSTCYKLECGHSFHTKCIIGCLSIDRKKCPSCNDRKNPSTELTLQGLKTVAIGYTAGYSKRSGYKVFIK